jgi:hypothetical protein
LAQTGHDVAGIQRVKQQSLPSVFNKASDIPQMAGHHRKMEKHSTRRSMGRWYVLVLISLMYLITYLDRVNISTAAPIISKEFDFAIASQQLSLDRLPPRTAAQSSPSILASRRPP